MYHLNRHIIIDLE